MKNIKIFTLSLVLLMAFTLTSYSQVARKSGFVFGVVGGGIFGVTDIQDNFGSMNVYSSIQTGYLFGLTKSVGSTFLLDFGYSSSMSLKAIDADGLVSGDGILNSVTFHNFQFGIIQTLNIGNFSIGIGGGGKFPIVAYRSKTIISELYDHGEPDLDSAVIFVNKIGGNLTPAPYIKAVLDYSLFVDTRTAVTFGLNIEYVFGTDDRNSVYDGNPEGLYIGGQIGVKLAPR